MGGVDCVPVKKVFEGRPNIADLLRDNKIDIVMNTTEGKQSLEDSKDIRYLALNNKLRTTPQLEELLLQYTA